MIFNELWFWKFPEMEYSKFNVVSFVFLGVIVSGASSCTADRNDLIDSERMAIINEKPIVKDAEASWSTKPPEKIAELFLDLLDANANGSSNEIRICAAESNPVSEKCQKDEAFDSECALKNRYWKGFVARHLSAAKIDLNNDGVLDYILRGNGCTRLSHSYTWDVFVLLSQKDKSYKIALNVNSNRFDVMPTIMKGGNVIVSGIYSYNGESLNIYVVDNGRYLPDTCFYRNNSENEFRKIDC